MAIKPGRLQRPGPFIFVQENIFEQKNQGKGEKLKS